MGIIDEKSYAFVPHAVGSAGWKNLSLFATGGIKDSSHFAAETNFDLRILQLQERKCKVFGIGLHKMVATAGQWDNPKKTTH